MMNNNFLKIGFLLVACFVSSSYASAMDVNLSDIDQTSRFYKSVSVFVTEGIIEGYDDGTFKADNQINRAEALKIILEAFKLENNPQAELTFSDVSNEAWFAEYVAVGLNEGIIKGYNDGTFKPGNQVNFVEALKMGLEAKGIDTTGLEFNSFHSGLNGGEWFAGLMSYGYEKNLFELEKDGTIAPGKPMTRGEFTELIYRVRDLPSNGNFDISYNWRKHSGRTAVESKLPVEWKSFDFGGNGILVGNENEEGADKIDFLDRAVDESRAVMYISSINEDLSADNYFLEVKGVLGEGWSFYEEAKLDGKLLIATNLQAGEMRLFYWVNSGKVLLGEAVFEADSEKKMDFEKIYRKMFRLVVASDSPGVASIQERLNEVRSNILVEGNGMNTIDLFVDKAIIHTDVVGVGTGPIDYYYIPVIEHTLKYEREADVILDMMGGETFDF